LTKADNMKQPTAILVLPVL